MSYSLVLPRELTIYTASETRADWLLWLASLPEDAVVDGAAVDQVDGAGLQLLVALRHAVRQRGRAWHVIPVSATLHEACRALGVSILLADETGKGGLS